MNNIQEEFNKNKSNYLYSSLAHRKSALDFVMLNDFPGRKDEDYK